MVSVRSLYEDSCIKFKCRQNAELLRTFPATEGRLDILTEVDLHDNLVGRKGIRPVMEVVKACSNCERVSVADNFLTNDSVKEIVGALMEHPGVRYLDLSRNPISHPAGKLLCDFASKSKTISEIILKDTLINPALIKIIQSKANENFMNADESVRRKYANDLNTQLPDQTGDESETGQEQQQLDEQNIISPDSTNRESVKEDAANVAVPADEPQPPTETINAVGRQTLQLIVDNLDEFTPPKTEYPPWWGIRTLLSLGTGTPRPEFTPRCDEVTEEPVPHLSEDTTPRDDAGEEHPPCTPLVKQAVDQHNRDGKENDKGKDSAEELDRKVQTWKNHSITASEGNGVLEEDDGIGIGLVLLASKSLDCPATDKPSWWYIESLDRIAKDKSEPSLPSAIVERKPTGEPEQVPEQAPEQDKKEVKSERKSGSIVRTSVPLGLIAMAANEPDGEGESLLKSITGMVVNDLGTSDGLNAAFAAMDVNEDKQNNFLGLELVRDIYEGRTSCSSNDIAQECEHNDIKFTKC